MTNQKGKRKKTIKRLVACLFAASLFLTARCFVPSPVFAFEKRFQSGVSVDGIDLSGNTMIEAQTKLKKKTERILATRSLTVYAMGRRYDFYAPEIACESDVLDVLERAVNYGKKRAERRVLRREGKDFAINRKFYLRGEQEIIEAIAMDTRVSPTSATMTFYAKTGTFSISPDTCGKELRRAELSLMITKAMQQESAVVTATYDDTLPEVTKAELQAFTALRARFSTSYATSQEGRKHNVALAAQSVSGVRLNNGQTFSFNGVVGARTEQNGYRSAKIIEGGKFVDGVGGGVCQVSTTLYNAALLAGLTVTEQHPHSLAVGYVEPSFDAMVSSGSSDLKFVNDTGGPVFLRMTADGSTLTAEVYGLKSTVAVQRKSVTVQKIEPPPRTEVEDDTGEVESGQIKVLQHAKSGIVSEGYLLLTENGITRQVRLRKDKYAPCAEIVAIGKKKAQGDLQDWKVYDIIPWAREFWKRHAT